MKEWILLAEKKPNINQKVIVSMRKDNGDTVIEKVTTDKWVKNARFQNIPTEYIVAWMPLPKPYKESEVEE